MSDHIPSDTDALRAGRHDRLLQELVHDTYKSKHKLPEPTVCPECGAVYHRGRWQWGDRPAGAHEESCPACQRVRDRVPQGFLTLRGEFLSEHLDEILALVRNVEEREKAERPLKRIMDTERTDEAVVISFTDAHLARGAGEAVHHAYKGALDFQYVEGGSLLRVSWSR
jgi:NMD protein affecting ribosome stability and mRNA decay